jgi:hypothetical protein
LWLIYFVPSDVSASQVHVKRGYPTKVLLHFDESAATRMTLRAWRCGDDRPLRFSYHGIPALKLPATATQLAKTGSLAVALGGQALSYSGYVNFYAASRWRFVLLDGSRVIASAIVQTTYSS